MHVHAYTRDHDQSYTERKTSLHYRYFLGIIINILFVGVEFFFGYAANSMTLVADAGHNLSDVLSLFLAAFANWIAFRQPSERYTYQLKKITILTSLINSFILLIVVGGIGWESIQRFKNPTEISGLTIIYLSAMGIFINFGTALLFLKYQKYDINVKAAFLHMAADALVSAGAFITGLLIFFFQLYWLDPVISLIIMIVILISIWGVTKETIILALEGVPRNIKIADVKKYLCQFDGVSGFHDLHIWALSTTEIALTVHLVSDEKMKSVNKFLHNVNLGLFENFKITHATIQMENSSDPDCNQGCSENILY